MANAGCIITDIRAKVKVFLPLRHHPATHKPTPGEDRLELADVIFTILNF
jgi:hypothetical protein